MKHLHVILPALLLCAACGNHDTTTTTITPTPTDGVETTPAGNNNSVGLAITQFAEWQRGAQGTVDGEYDPQEGMFIPCGSNQGVKIEQTDVKLLAGGSCDAQGTKLEAEHLVVIQRSGNAFTVISRNVTLQDVSKEKGAGEYKTDAGTKKIVVDPATMNRIKASQTLMHAPFIHH